VNRLGTGFSSRTELRPGQYVLSLYRHTTGCVRADRASIRADRASIRADRASIRADSDSVHPHAVLWNLDDGQVFQYWSAYWVIPRIRALGSDLHRLLAHLFGPSAGPTSA